MIPDHAVSVTIEVPFHHCDPLLVVWHGHYFEYLSAARTALMKARRLDVEDVRGMGYKMYITDARCRYGSPLAYGELAKITAWVKESTPLIRVSYTIENLTAGRHAARAYTVVACTDFAGNLISETPNEIRARLPE